MNDRLVDSPSICEFFRGSMFWAMMMVFVRVEYSGVERWEGEVYNQDEEGDEKDIECKLYIA